MNICTCSSPEMAFSSIERLHGRNMFQLQSKYFHRTCSAKRDSVHVDNCERGRTLVVCNRSVPGNLGEVISGKTQLNGTSRKLKLIRTLLIDNYDSYTYNIFQELSVINGVAPVVIRNDEWQWDDAYHYLYEEKAFDNIVISPGPGSPTCPADIGICLALLSKCRDIPILGVCLGHQALGFVHGAKVVRGIEPVHGRLSDVEHNSCSLFRGIPSGTNSGFKVVRYHSLVIDPQSLPKELVPIAWTSNDVAVPYLGVQGARDRPATESVFVNSSSATNSRRIKPSSDKTMKKNESVLMGIMHTSRPHYGLQFHPESVATCHGRQIFKNFAEITQDHWIRLGSPLSREREELHRAACVQVSDISQLFNGNGRGSHPVNDIHKHLSTHNMGKLTLSNGSLKFLKLTWKKLPSQASRAGGARNIFDRIFGHHKGKDTFWLDSSSVEKGRARFSFMGGKGGTLWKQIIFNLPNKSSTMSSASGGHLSIQDAQGSTESIFLKDGFFDFLNKELQSFSYDEKDFEGLPFDFRGGYIGYIGYDLKVECGMASNRHKSTAPDACFFFADNFLVIDHDNDDIYIMSVNDTKSSNKAANWLDDIEHKILMLKFDSTCNDHRIPRQTSSQDSGGFGFVAEKTKQQYINDVERCQRLIRDGESYELCLTTQLKKKMEVKDDDPFGIYLKLREKNPAPYAAWLNFSTEKLSICSSSPERFLRLDKNGNLEAKPIKGTIARGLTKDEDELLKLQLLYSEKDQAENLMIVDLLRNDLGRVCEPGSVHVPHLMEIESYATVHTMVSTIRGEKRSDLSPIDCVRAAFPGGSMTGAPKLRSMELLDNDLETSSRGIYSGCIGYFSYDQTFDLNIVIRTVVIHDDEASIGAGGAITALSSPDEEYKEMILKTKAPANAVYEYESKKENLSIVPDI